MAGVCAAPQPDEGLVQGLLGSVNCNVRAMAEAGYGADVAVHRAEQALD